MATSKIPKQWEYDAPTTSEQRIGTWTDARPIYRQVFTQGLPNEADSVIVGTITNFYKLVSARFILRKGNIGDSSGFQSDGAIFSGTDTSKINVGFGQNNGVVVYKSSVPAYFGVAVIMAIVEYTKSTDY